MAAVSLAGLAGLLNSTLINGRAAAGVTDAPADERESSSLSRAALVSPLAGAPPAAPRKSALDRAVEHRDKGNACLAANNAQVRPPPGGPRPLARAMQVAPAARDHLIHNVIHNAQDAADAYTCAINADPGDARSYSNRSAAHAVLGRFADALVDAEQALRLDPTWPKAWGRKGLALFKLKRYPESLAAYETGLKCDPANADLALSLQMVTAILDSQATPRESEPESITGSGEELGRSHRAAPAPAPPARPGPPRKARPPPSPPEDESSRHARLVREHAADVARIRAERDAAVAKWRVSTGSVAESLPMDSRNSSPCVDVFGTCRGAGLVPGPDGAKCRAWTRDSSRVTSWSDLTVLTCDACGLGHTLHEDCGPARLEEPSAPAPSAAGRVPMAGVVRSAGGA